MNLVPGEQVFIVQFPDVMSSQNLTISDGSRSDRLIRVNLSTMEA